MNPKQSAPPPGASLINTFEDASKGQGANKPSADQIHQQFSQQFGNPANKGVYDQSAHTQQNYDQLAKNMGVDAKDIQQGLQQYYQQNKSFDNPQLGLAQGTMTAEQMAQTTPAVQQPGGSMGSPIPQYGQPNPYLKNNPSISNPMWTNQPPANTPQSGSKLNLYSSAEPTYVFENDKVYAFVNGRVVASATDMDELESKLAAAPTPEEYDDSEYNEDRGHCSRCMRELNVNEDEGGWCGPCKREYDEKRSATHITTPNGLKGKILGKAKDIWGETVTVRLENGRVAQFHVTEDCQYTSEKVASEQPIVGLSERLAATNPGDIESLKSRRSELTAISAEARDLALGGLSDSDLREIDRIRSHAKAELEEITARLEYLADAEEFSPASPTYEVFEQESIGGGDASWLDTALGDMIVEANSTDWDRMMDEGPEVFVAGLDTGALADAGATRSIASTFIRSKTAGANDEARDEFEQTWLARVESLRRAELASRKEKTKKEAAAEPNVDDAPDSALFG